MNNKKYTITIDGPAASGKGSLAKIVSGDLNLYYMETGIYYRILAKNILDPWKLMHFLEIPLKLKKF